MKELSIEEKAKRYDESLEKARKLKDEYNDIEGCYPNQWLCEELFPELAESEDERIRKQLLKHLREVASGKSLELSTTDYERWATWVEKQGEHANFRNKIQIGDKVTRNEDGVLVNLSQLNRVAKPADKVEPKFKIGDFIVNDYCMGKVVEITNDAYLLDTEQGIPFSSHNIRLWDITKDAMDGDVLINDFHWIFIFKEIKNNMYISHCSIIDRGIDVIVNSMVEREAGDINLVKCHPATKEQHDLLFKKMHEAGYEWDAEKKELKKIEQKPAYTKEYDFHGIKFIPKFAKGDIIKDKKCGEVSTIEDFSYDTGLYTHTYGQFPITIQDNYEIIEQESAWGKEDEKIIRRIDSLLYSQCKIHGSEYEEIHNWLKSLTPQPKQEWSEEDKNRINRLIAYFEDKESFTAEDDVVYANWLKSLRPQNRWKPSDEQIDALEDAIADAVSSIQKNMLNSLYTDLKKL